MVFVRSLLNYVLLLPPFPKILGFLSESKLRNSFFSLNGRKIVLLMVKIGSTLYFPCNQYFHLMTFSFNVQN